MISASPSSAYDHLFKILLVGNSKTGKYDIRGRMAGEEFIDGSAFEKKNIPAQNRTVDNGGVAVLLNIWVSSDNDGDYRGVNAVVVVYDVSDRSSYNNLTEQLDRIRHHCNDNTAIILVGNKCDLSREKHAVTFEEASSFAEKKGIAFLEVSAKTGTNIEQLVSTCRGMCLQNCGIRTEIPVPPRPALTSHQPINTGKKIGLTILSASIGTSGALVAGLALFGIMNVWTPVGLAILGTGVFIAAAITMGEINKSFLWGAIGLIPGVNLLAALGYGAKNLYDNRSAKNNEPAPQGRSTSAPRTDLSQVHINRALRTLPPAVPYDKKINSEAKATILDPQSGELIQDPVPSTTSYWAKLFSCFSSRPVTHALPHKLDDDKSKKNSELF